MCIKRIRDLLIIPAIIILISPSAFTQEAVNTTAELQIVQQPLADAIKIVADEFDLQIAFYSEITEGIESPNLIGTYTATQALDALLKKTALEHKYVDAKSVAITPRSGIIGGSEPGKSRPASNKILVAQAETSAEISRTTSGSTTRSNQGKESRLEIEEVIVTAQKRAQNIKEVPMSIVALTADELDFRLIENFEDLGLAVPGLSVIDSGTNQRRVYMRGIANITGGSSLVGIYLDEIALSGGSSAQQPDLRTYDLERVEVLRGPQGTLYGQGSAGGTIRFVTRNPELDHFSGSGSVTASFTKEGEPGQQVSGVVNVPLVQDKLAIRIAGMYENYAGWIDQPAADKEDINDQDVVNVRAKILWRPTDALQIGGMVNIHNNDAGAAPISEDENGDYRQSFGRLTTPSSDDEYEIYNLTLSYDFDNVNLFSSSSYINSDKSLNDQNLENGGGPGLDLAISTDYDAEIFTQEIRLTSTTEGPWQWTAGGFYQTVEADSLFAFEFGLPIGIVFFGDSNTTHFESDSWAVFGETSYLLTERFEVGGGLRYFEDKRESTDASGTQSDTFDSLSPRAFAKFQLTEDVNIYASVAKGFRSGGFNTLGFPAYGPESVWTVELGTKAIILDGRFDADIAVFFSRFKDFQAFAQRIVPFNIFDNAGEAEIKGVEWALTWHPTEDLTFGFDGNYVDTEYVEVIADQLVAAFFEGDPIDFVPSYQFSLSGSYEFNIGSIPGFIRLDYNQRARLRDINRAQNFISSSPVINMLNLNVGLEWNQDISFGVFAKNLLNDRDFLDPFAASGSSARPRPLTVGLQLDVNF